MAVEKVQGLHSGPRSGAEIRDRVRVEKGNELWLHAQIHKQGAGKGKRNCALSSKALTHRTVGSSAPIPSVFKNGWRLRRRCRNFSTETLTSRESPGA